MNRWLILIIFPIELLYTLIAYNNASCSAKTAPYTRC